MSRLPARPGTPEVCLPAVVEELLVEVVADGFSLYCCGPKAAPRALVAAYEWEDCWDLLTVRDFARVVTARVPKQGAAVDLFDPEAVLWAYEGPPQHAVRALLWGLVHPAHPAAPTTSYPAPVSLRVPRAQQRPMTIQLAADHRAGIRAARLSATMSARRGAVAVAVAGPARPPDRRLAVG